MASNPAQTIKSAHRVLEILEYFNRARQHVTVMEMSRTLNYPQSSTSELLRCLNRLGYLEYDRNRRAYCPTTRVAVLGSWVQPTLFRGGPVLSTADDVARQLGQTVVLSTSINFELRHLQVIQGSSSDAISYGGEDHSDILHSPQGLLLLSSHTNDELRGALHRLNAEQRDMSRHVRPASLLAKCEQLRERGWLVEPDHNGIGCVAVLLNCDGGRERLVMSVVARREIIAHRSERILELLLSRRNVLVDKREVERSAAPGLGSVVPMRPPRATVGQRRYGG